MEFTPLATFLIAFFSSAVTSTIAVVVTIFKMTKNFVSVGSCSDHRQSCGQLTAKDQKLNETTELELRSAITDLKKSSRIQYHMLRALVAYMPNLSNQERERILNAGQARKNDDMV